VELNCKIGSELPSYNWQIQDKFNFNENLIKFTSSPLSTNQAFTVKKNSSSLRYRLTQEDAAKNTNFCCANLQGLQKMRKLQQL